MASDMLKSSVSPTVKNMLRDAIKVLCQSAVRFEAQLSIQALIGITVDGAEVLLVDIREQIDKTCVDDEDLASARQNSDGQKPNNTGGYRPSTCNDTLTDSAMNVKQEHNEMAYTVYAATMSSVAGRRSHSKKSLRKLRNSTSLLPGNSSFSANVGQCNNNFESVYAGESDPNVEQHADADGQPGRICKSEARNSTPFNDNQRRIEATEFVGDDDINADDQFYELTTGIHSYPANEQQFIPMGRTTSGIGANGRSGMCASTGVPKRRTNTLNHNFTGNISSISGSEFPRRRATARRRRSTIMTASSAAHSGNGDPTVLSPECYSSQMYACDVCGQTMRHKWSFIRHKRQHDGIVFRCEICGKVLSRSDKFTAHKRLCEAQQNAANGNAPV